MQGSCIDIYTLQHIIIPKSLVSKDSSNEASEYCSESCQSRRAEMVLCLTWGGICFVRSSASTCVSLSSLMKVSAHVWLVWIVTCM